MPVCWRCERMASSAEIRRSPKGGVCKDKRQCAIRQAVKRKEGKK